jgi:Flp pilus assembly protein TadD
LGRHNLGVALAQEGRLHEAVEHLERAVQLKPDYADAYYCLGGVLNQLGRRDEAIARLRQCLQIQPLHAGASNNLGRCGDARRFGEDPGSDVGVMSVASAQ